MAKSNLVKNLLNSNVGGLVNMDSILNPGANKQTEPQKKEEENQEEEENQNPPIQQEQPVKAVVKAKRIVSKVNSSDLSINNDTTLEQIMEIVFKKREEKSKDYALSGYILPTLYKKLNILCEIRGVSTKEALSNILELFFIANDEIIQKELREYMKNM